ncbi:MAG: glycosyltransferase family 2 protein [Gemmobacter sp.]
MRILAVLTVRDEGAFLIDWLAHHRACGITDFLVVSNDCSDGTDAMLDRLQAMGWLTHLRNEGPFEKGPQWHALALADRHPLVGAADWAVVLDIDEYLNIDIGDRTVPALLAARPGATAFALPWRMFGNAGVVGFEDRPVAQQFTRSAPPVLFWPWRAQLVKTLFRNDGSYRKLGVHRPRSPEPSRMGGQRWFDGSGRQLAPGWARAGFIAPLGSDNGALARINHYALGAMESYVLKCARGRANREASGLDMGYWVERNFAALEDRSILALEPQVAPLRGALRGDAELGRLHAAAVAWRRRRFENLMQDEPVRALFGRLLMSAPTRVLTAAEAAPVLRHARAPRPRPA